MDKDINHPVVNETDSLLKFLAKAEGALEVYFLSHHSVGRDWDLAAGQIADLDDSPTATHIGYR